MISINRKRLTEIKKQQIATDLIDNKRSNALVYLVLVFNVNGAKHKIINIESMSDVDKLLTSKYLHKARNCNFNATNREQNVYYAYPALSTKVANLIMKKRISKYIEIEFKDEHVFSIMSIYQQLVKKSQNISDGFVDIPPIWYEPTKDMLYDLYGNKPISAIVDRQNKAIKKIKDLHNE